MQELFNQISIRVKEILKTHTSSIGDIASMLSEEFSLPLETAREYVCLCALSSSLGVEVYL